MLGNHKVLAAENVNGMIWKLHAGTTLGKTDSNWSFAVGDYDGDGVKDLSLY